MLVGLLTLASMPAFGVEASSQRQTIKLVAKDNVTVTVRQTTGPEDTDGTVVFQGALKQGETREVERRGLLLLESESLNKLAVEINGKQFDVAKIVGPGQTKAMIQAPAAR